MPELRYRIVDVFSDRPLSGNGLCVVLDRVDGDDEGVMLAIAREVNLSETTFVARTGDGSYGNMRVGGHVAGCAAGAFTL